MENTPTSDPRLDIALDVVEIFKSIQGESTWAGCPCTFVRLAGCNLRCAYCDTAYAYSGGVALTVREIIEQVTALSCPLVEITGGEPLLQAGCPVLAACLLERGFTVLVETNGATPIGGLPAGAIRIMDLKCPGSGMSDRILWDNLADLTRRDEVKFVLGDRADYEWSRDVLKRYDLASRCGAVLFSAAHGRIEPRAVAEWMLEDNLPARFQLQLHKFIWPPDQRGV